jgi:hypothetical protein
LTTNVSGEAVSEFGASAITNCWPSPVASNRPTPPANIRIVSNSSCGLIYHPFASCVQSWAALGSSVAGGTPRRESPIEALVLDRAYESFRYLHHPLRAASAVKYIDPSLKLPQEIQQTGDIFFPTRWMDATLGGHRSPEAAAIVRDFLARALTRAVAICLA